MKIPVIKVKDKNTNEERILDAKSDNKILIEKSSISSFMETEDHLEEDQLMIDFMPLSDCLRVMLDIVEEKAGTDDDEVMAIIFDQWKNQILKLWQNYENMWDPEAYERYKIQKEKERKIKIESRVLELHIEEKIIVLEHGNFEAIGYNRIIADSDEKGCPVIIIRDYEEKEYEEIVRVENWEIAREIAKKIHEAYENTGGIIRIPKLVEKVQKGYYETKDSLLLYPFMEKKEEEEPEERLDSLKKLFSSGWKQKWNTFTIKTKEKEMKLDLRRRFSADRICCNPTLADKDETGCPVIIVNDWMTKEFEEIVRVENWYIAYKLAKDLAREYECSEEEDLIFDVEEWLLDYYAEQKIKAMMKKIKHKWPFKAVILLHDLKEILPSSEIVSIVSCMVKYVDWHAGGFMKLTPKPEKIWGNAVYEAYKGLKLRLERDMVLHREEYLAAIDYIKMEYPAFKD